LVNRLRDGVYVTNEHGRLLDANRALLEILGLSSIDDLRQQPMDSLLRNPHKGEEKAELLRRHGEVKDFEYQVRRPDGELRTVLDSCQRVEDPESGEAYLEGMLSDITTRREMEGRLRELSIRDPLTGCYNRRYLQQLEASSQRLEHWGAIFVDIDHFKVFNDEHGHQAGDDVLIKVSRFLMQKTRAEDSVIRMGGDEFLVLLLGAHANFTGDIVGRLKVSAAEVAPCALSFGWAQRDGEESLGETIGRADRELIVVRVKQREYEIKRRTKGPARSE
jgi:diguanylate cyclase (GGDEF)-like protein/PAS domain S-box-containing protein